MKSKNMVRLGDFVITLWEDEDDGYEVTLHHPSQESALEIYEYDRGGDIEAQYCFNTIRDIVGYVLKLANK